MSASSPAGEIHLRQCRDPVTHLAAERMLSPDQHVDALASDTGAHVTPVPVTARAITGQPLVQARRELWV